MDTQRIERGPAGRARVSDELIRVLADRYGIGSTKESRDLGGSSTLNLLIEDDGKRYVVRVYRPWMTTARLAAMQDARHFLIDDGIPCVAPILTGDRAAWTRSGNRLVEVEPYVEANGKMDTWARLEAGLPLLGRIHSRLHSFQTAAEGRHAPASNSIAPENLVSGVRAGTRRLREWDLTSAERDLAALADLADALAVRVATAEGAMPQLPRQLVHGDFWDNNVLSRNEEIVLVADLDFMGERARIDDLALTLYYTNSTFTDDQLSDARIRQLRTLVDAYDSGLDDPLSESERRAIPLAIARTTLGFIAMIAETDSDVTGRRHALEMKPDIAWANTSVDHLDRWQDAMT